MAEKHNDPRIWDIYRALYPSYPPIPERLPRKRESGKQFYQSNPEFDDGHHNSWSSSLVSYYSKAWKEASIIIKARQDYLFSATLRIDADLSVPEHRTLWRKISRNLLEFIYFAVRESTKSNHLHYHFTIYTGEEAVLLSKRLHASHFNECISTALNPSKFNLHINSQPPDDNWVKYTLKTSKRGRKPLLFKKGLGLAKVMYSKGFFPIKKAQVWRDIWLPKWEEDYQWRQYLEAHPEIMEQVAIESHIIDRFFDIGTRMRHIPSYRYFKNSFQFLLWKRKSEAEAEISNAVGVRNAGAVGVGVRAKEMHDV